MPSPKKKLPKFIKINKVFNSRNEYLLGRVAEVIGDGTSADGYNCYKVIPAGKRTWIWIVKTPNGQEIDPTNLAILKR